MNYDKEEELPDAPLVSAARRWLGRIFAGLALVVGVVLAVWLFVTPPPVPAELTPRQKKLQAQTAYLEGRLSILAANLARPGPTSATADQVKLIEEAIARQTELSRLRPAPLPEDQARLAEWQAKLGDVQAREWNRQSAECEAAAGDLLARDPAGAVAKLKEALRLQREVNGGPASPAQKNYGREARLEQQAEQQEAEPLQAEGARLLAQAHARVAASRWSEALELFGRARDIQLKLNHDYARTRFTDQLAADRIETEMTALGAADTHDQLEALVARADEAAAAQKPAEADQLLGEAMARQRAINEQFAKSRFVSMERIEQLETRRQTLRLRPVLAEVRALDAQAAGHLRRRELFQTQQLVAAALAKLENALALWPKAAGVDEALRQRLSYLNLREADLVLIQDQTYDLLLPLPGHEQAALLKTEVPQALFARVMNGNPSRNAGRALPVDSVTFAEAEEFCRRLGWVLGAPVRLPTAAEFRVAVGDPVATGANAWGLENGPGKTQPTADKPANALGFHDLLGNVAEWLAADTGDTAVLAGGSYAESRAQLQAVPMRSAAKTERARTNGFRVLAELDLAAPR